MTGHIILHHLSDYMEITGKTLCHANDQVGEAVHHSVKQFLECHPNYNLMVDESPKVTCLRCDAPACPSCYTDRSLDWVYICHPCNKVVREDLGLGRLEDKHLISKFRGKEVENGMAKELPKEVVSEEVINLEEDPEERTSQEDMFGVTQEEQEQEEDVGSKEEEEGIENAFIPVKWRNKAKVKKSTPTEAKIEDSSKKTNVCIHHKKGRCKFGISGRKMVDGRLQECEYQHPRVCDKLLREGDRSKSGCKGGCEKFHPKMCFSSMNTKTCEHDKECRNGYHVRGTKKSSNPNLQAAMGGQKKKSSPPTRCLANFPNLGVGAAAAPATFAPVPAAPATPAPAPFLDVAAVVRSEMIAVLRELKVTPTPPPPPKEKVVWDILRGNKDEMRGILRELGFLGF